MKPDGSIYIDTPINTDGFTEGTADIKDQFEGLAKTVNDTSKAINKMMDKPAKKIALTAQAEELAGKLDFAKAKLQELKEGQAYDQRVLENYKGFDADYFVEHEDYQRILASQDEISNKIKEQQALVDELQKQYDSVNAKLEKQAQKIQQANASINQQTAQTQASAVAAQQASDASGAMAISARAASNAARSTGNATQKAARAAEKLNRQTGDVAYNMDRASGSMRRFGTRLSSIVTSALFFNIISSGLRTMVSGIWNAVASTNEMQQALANLRGAAYTAAAPLINVLAKAFATLANAIASALSYLTKFYSFVTGKSLSSLAEQGQQMGNLADSTDSVTDSVKKAKRALAGFDEIERLTFEEDVDTSGISGIENNYDYGLDGDMLDSGYEMLALIGTIGAALAGLGIGKLLYQLGLGHDKLGMMTGAALTLGGAFLEATSIASMLMDGMNWKNLFGGVLGAAGLTAGAAILGKQFGNALLGGGIGAIVAGVPLLCTAIYDAMENGLTETNALLIPLSTTLVGAGIGALFGPVGAGIGALIGLIVGLFADCYFAIVEQFGSLGAFFSEIWEGIKEIAVEVWSEIVAKVKDFVKNLTTMLNEGAALLSAFFASIAEWIMNLLSMAWDFIVDFFTKAWEAVVATVESFMEFLNTLGEFILETFTALWQAAWTAIKDFFITIWTNIKTTAQNIWQEMQNMWSTVANWFRSNVTEPLQNFFSKMWENIRNAASTTWNYFKSVWQSASTWFSNTVITPISNAFNNLKNTIKNILNGIIGFINGMLSSIASGINSIFSMLNRIQITIPSWVPGYGGNTFGFNLASVTAPQIPYLAKGAVIPPNAPFLAMLGDQRHGTNIEAPLSTIQDAVAEVMGDMLPALVAGFEAMADRQDELISVVKNIKVGDTTIGKAAARYQNRQNLRQGGSFG